MTASASLERSTRVATYFPGVFVDDVPLLLDLPICACIELKIHGSGDIGTYGRRSFQGNPSAQIDTEGSENDPYRDNELFPQP